MRKLNAEVYKVCIKYMSRPYAIKVAVSVRLDPQTVERLGAVADRYGCTLGKAATMALERGVPLLEQAHGPRPLQEPVPTPPAPQFSPA